MKIVTLQSNVSEVLTAVCGSNESWALVAALTKLAKNDAYPACGSQVFYHVSDAEGETLQAVFKEYLLYNPKQRSDLILVH